MKILVTGPGGFVGSRIMDAAEATGSPSLRSFREDDIRRLIDSEAPDAVIHTAAISDIGTCEADPEASYRANVEIPVWIAGCGVKTVAFSSDQVYGGCEGKGPYAEDDAAPANLYARHKLEMENRTLDINPDTVLLRATWMYDMPRYGSANRGNFLMNMLRGGRLSFSSSQYRGLTYVRQVAEMTLKAIGLPGGVYNFGSENSLSMYDTAVWLAETLNIRAEITDAGERHNLWMDCSKLKRNGIGFDSTTDGLKRCIKDYSLMPFSD